jgi:hypothetical protein
MIGAEVGPLLGDIMANLGVIALVSVGIGASAPKWPREWLSRDVGPLRLNRWETVELYRRSRISQLARSLPEAGAALGGVSKRSHPRRTRKEIVDYLVETRRGEWVHWLAMLAVYVGLCGLSFVVAGMLSSWMAKAKIIGGLFASLFTIYHD